VRIQIPPGHRPASFLRMDDPEHNRLRSMIAQEFTARRVKQMQEPVQKLIDELLDDLADRPRPADLHDAFSRKLPTLFIARTLGVPDEDSPHFVELTRTTIAQDDLARSLAAYTEMSDYLADLVREKLERPTDDIVSRLAVNYLAKDLLTVDEAAGIARLVLVAGHETTTNQLALNVLSLLLDDKLRHRVLANGGELVPTFVEESMRYWSISQDAILRLVVEDVELGGVQMRAGDAVVISIPAGNHDAATFPCPHMIKLDRPNTTDHLQWGAGPHYCQGAPLARLEMDLSLRTLFRRFPSLELAERPEELFRRGTVFHGVERLPVNW
jgi:cytochrome P450